MRLCKIVMCDFTCQEHCRKALPSWCTSHIQCTVHIAPCSTSNRRFWLDKDIPTSNHPAMESIFLRLVIIKTPIYIVCWTSKDFSLRINKEILILFNLPNLFYNFN